jgi:molecular chaperone HscB
MNYFELYQLPITLKMDKNILRKKYYLLSKAYHPDFFDVTKGVSIEENLKMSAMVNEGYKVLQDAYTTIGYILTLKGYLTEQEKYQLPNDFLMEMMDLNEELDAANTIPIDNLQVALQKEVADLLVVDDMEVLDDHAWQQIKAYYFKEKYIRRLKSRLNGEVVED